MLLVGCFAIKASKFFGLKMPKSPKMRLPKFLVARFIFSKAICNVKLEHLEAIRFVALTAKMYFGLKR